MKNITKEVQNQNMRELEYILKELHKEWEQPKEYVAVLLFDQTEVEFLKLHIVERIGLHKEYLEEGEFTFQEMLKKSKEMFVQMRILEKVIAVEKGMKRKNRGINVALDSEEFQAVKKMFRE